MTEPPKPTHSQPRVAISAGMIQGGRSGVGRYVIELVTRLKRQPRRCELLVIGLEKDRALFPGIAEEHWIPIPAWAEGGPLNLLWHQVFLPAILRKHKVKLLHIPSYRRILAFSPVPQLATIHDCAPFVLRDKYDGLRGFFGRHVIPPLARRCARVIAVSETTRNDLREFMKIPEDKLRLVLNGIGHEDFYPRTEAELRAFREKKDLRDPYFFYLARIEHPGKNHLRLIEGFDQFRNEGHPARLVLAGADWHGAEAVHRRAGQSRFSGDIRFTGFADEAEIPLYYGASRAVIFPSLMEGFGLPVLEAMACGTPVACSTSGSLREVGGEAARFFNPLEPGEIAEAMRELYYQPTWERREMIERGQHWAGRFHWDKAAEQTLQIYREEAGLPSS